MRPTRAPRVVTVLVAALGAVGCWSERSRATPDGFRPELTELVRETGTYRRYESRLTGAFAYAEPLGPRRGKSDVESPSGVRLVTAKLERAAGQSDAPRDRAALASAYFMSGESGRAVRLLETIVADDGTNAALWSDLSAAYLARATDDDNPQDLVRAVDAADRALDLQRDLRPARFNLALGLERLSIASEARTVWRAYNDGDQQSGWGRESREHDAALQVDSASSSFERERQRLLDALERRDQQTLDRLVSANAQWAREIWEEQLLPQWARLYREGHASEARQQLASLQQASDAFARAHADALAGRTTDHLSSILTRGDGRRARAIATAILIYDQARQLYDQDRFAEADPLYVSAASQLEMSGSPFAVRALFQESVTRYYLAQFDMTARLLDRVQRIGQAGQYFALVGRAHWIRGLLRAMPAGFAQRMDDYRAALDAFERGGERPNAAAVHLLLAETLELYGERKSAWQQRHFALTALPETRDPKRRHAVLLDTTRAALQEGFPRAAKYICGGLLEAARTWQRPVALAEGYGEQLRWQIALGQGPQARQAAGDLIAWLQRIPDASIRARLEPFALRSQAEAEELTDPRRALQTADAARARFKQSGLEHHLFSIAKIEAHAWGRLGDRTRARQALERAVDELDGQRDALHTEVVRLSYTAEVWGIYRDLIELVLADGDASAAAAFSYAERGRAKDLADARREIAEVSTNLETVTAQVPEGTTLVSYLLLDRSLVAWVIRRGEAHIVRQPLAAEQLRHVVQRYRTALEYGDDRVESALSRQLYSFLIQPLASWIGPSDRVVIVPDDALNGVPFAALTDPRSNAVLVKTHSVLLSPSVRSFIGMSGRLESMGEGRSIALIYDSGTTSGAAGRLAGVNQEVAGVARSYADVRRLPGDVLSKEAVLDGLAVRDIVHITGHAIEQPDNPANSRLVLADRDGSREVDLFPSDIERARIEAVRLVVLAACRTGIGQLHAGASPLSLARPFLKKGVPSVVAALWDVDDRDTAFLMVRFHQHLHRHGDVALALREAQLDALASTDPRLRRSAAWSGFTALGAVRPY